MDGKTCCLRFAFAKTIENRILNILCPSSLLGKTISIAYAKMVGKLFLSSWLDFTRAPSHPIRSNPCLHGTRIMTLVWPPYDVVFLGRFGKVTWQSNTPACKRAFSSVGRVDPEKFWLRAFWLPKDRCISQNHSKELTLDSNCLNLQSVTWASY